jgi:magnesium transporter
VSVANALEEELKYTRSIVGDLLSDLENDIDRENLKRLLHYSRRLAGFRGRTRYVLQSIEEVLESGQSSSILGHGAQKLTVWMGPSR